MPMRRGLLPARSQLDSELVEPVEQVPRGAQRKARVIFAAARRAEEREETVAEELVHPSPLPFHGGDGQREKSVEEVDGRFRRPARHPAREAPDVGEEDGHFLHFAAEVRVVFEDLVADIGADELAERLTQSLAPLESCRHVVEPIRELPPFVGPAVADPHAEIAACHVLGRRRVEPDPAHQAAPHHAHEEATHRHAD
jgi:hypothetical protein